VVAPSRIEFAVTPGVDEDADELLLLLPQAVTVRAVTAASTMSVLALVELDIPSFASY
jgi:hypothetical protein